MCAIVSSLQVPNMAEYIAKWGRRVGFDLNAEPSEGQKTHAIIQVLHAAVQRFSSPLCAMLRISRSRVPG